MVGTTFLVLVVDLRSSETIHETMLERSAVYMAWVTAAALTLIAYRLGTLLNLQHMRYVRASRDDGGGMGGV